jgi:hypothetical protein
MSLAAAKTTLKAIVEAQGGIPAHWVKRSAAVRPPAHVRLDLLGIRAVGQEESRLALPEDATALEQYRFANRVLRVQIAVETQSQELEKSALEYADRIRSRLRFEEVRAELEAAGLAFAGADEVTALDYDDREGRTISFAGFEARFNFSRYEQGEDIDWIVTATGTGEIGPSDPATEVPVSVDLDE